jgi:hypothetical protein
MAGSVASEIISRQHRPGITSSIAASRQRQPRHLTATRPGRSYRVAPTPLAPCVPRRRWPLRRAEIATSVGKCQQRSPEPVSEAPHRQTHRPHQGDHHGSRSSHTCQSPLIVIPRTRIRADPGGASSLTSPTYGLGSWPQNLSRDQELRDVTRKESGAAYPTDAPTNSAHVLGTIPAIPRVTECPCAATIQVESTLAQLRRSFGALGASGEQPAASHARHTTIPEMPPRHTHVATPAQPALRKPFRPTSL